MNPENFISENDKSLWKKIKRNGNFNRKRKTLVQHAKIHKKDNLHHPESDPIDPSPHASTSNEPNCSSSNWYGMHLLNELGDERQPPQQQNERNSEVETDSETEMEAINLKADMVDFREDLKNWAIQFQIKHTALNSLLALLKCHIPDNVLPKDARTLVGTPRNTCISADSSIGGEYWHYGLCKILKEALSTYEKLPHELSLNVNIDGLPTFKSSTTSFWPILVNVHEIRRTMSPLVVGIFCGASKPKDINAFLTPFVSELNEILENGLVINQQLITIKLRCFICDTPARSMLRGVIGHNGYNSCLKCVTEGEYSYAFKTMIFPETNAALRNDSDFRSRAYEGHHKFDSILETIRDLDMVKDFPIGDSLHLIDLGITKRLLNGWKSGTLNNYNAKWSAKEVENVSKFLKTCKLPREFQRPVRGLDNLPRWKGTELRTFLLYLSVVVLKKFFESNEILDHFLNFFCAIQICIRHDQNPSNYEIARSLIMDFLNGVKTLYGEQLFCSNMHSLTHLVDDVERFGPLDSFDAYPFESKLYTLKRLVRSGKLPLSQIARRICEMQKNLFNQRAKPCEPRPRPVLKRKLPTNVISDQLYTPQLEDSSDVYSFIDFGDYCIDTEKTVDRWILTRNMKVVCIDHIVHNRTSDSILLLGQPLNDLSDLFTKPVLSSSLQIFGSNLKHTARFIIQSSEIYCKMVKIDCQDATLPRSVFFPLIHTIR